MTASPPRSDVSVFGGYFPFASRYSLDVPVLFNHYGLKEIWEEAYGEVENVTWLSAGAWDPCNFVTVDPIRSLADLDGKRVFTFPTAGRFLQRFGVVPVTLPWEDIEVAVQTGELDGISWSGITEDYTVGWADVNNYYLTNNISGAWSGSYFANSERWNELPGHLQELFRLCMGLVTLLPPALVLVGRGLLPHHRRQAGTDLDPGIGMAGGRDQGPGVLGRDRRGKRPQRPRDPDPEELPRDHGQGGPAVPLRLSGVAPGDHRSSQNRGRRTRCSRPRSRPAYGSARPTTACRPPWRYGSRSHPSASVTGSHRAPAQAPSGAPGSPPSARAAFPSR